jgi:hypothetical protein
MHLNLGLIVLYPYTTSLLKAWIRKCGRKFTGIIKFGMNPHQDTRTGFDAVTT